MRGQCSHDQGRQGMSTLLPPSPTTIRCVPAAGMLAVFREDIIMDDSTKYEDDAVPEVSSQPPIGV